MSAALLWLIVDAWPTPPAPGAEPRSSFFVGRDVVLGAEESAFLVVILAGALGGVIHALRSLYWYVGNRGLRRSWLAFYICIPFIGAALAAVFYIVVRGGLMLGATVGEDVGVTAAAGVREG